MGTSNTAVFKGDGVRVLVTGANGFIGRALCSTLIDRGVAVNRSVRRFTVSGDEFVVGDIDGSTDWRMSLAGCDAVVHLAGRAHQLDDRALDPLEEFRRVNVQGSLILFSQAAAQGVKRFVYLSSIGVNGNQTVEPFTEADIPRPCDPYAISKLEAEVGLKKLAAETGVELVIIRPPLVYGLDAPGNFGRLVRWMSKGIPLPLGAIHNRRSLVALGNLIDLIVVCLKNQAAANQIFLVSDGEDISTTDLLKRIAFLTQKSNRLLPVPLAWVERVAIIIGQGDTARRLCRDLRVDISKARDLLGWSPPLTLDEGLLVAMNGIVGK
jgi:nucleoside-diphosphate-sugar epimerase